jgi:tRNA G18 (ribose-2'-O)-methylase SpoU
MGSTDEETSDCGRMTAIKYPKASSADEAEGIAETSRLRGIRYNVHTLLQHKPVDELRHIAEKIALPVHLMLLNLDGNMNIAMSIRTAAVLGCSDVWIVGRRKYDARPEVGSKHYIRVHKVGELTDPKKFFDDAGIQPFIIEQGGTPIEEMKFKPYLGKPVCFVMGSESHGISPEFATALADAPRITISQYGLVRSLNVSIAASIVMYEFLKQWRQQRKDV